MREMKMCVVENPGFRHKSEHYGPTLCDPDWLTHDRCNRFQDLRRGEAKCQIILPLQWEWPWPRATHSYVAIMSHHIAKEWELVSHVCRQGQFMRAIVVVTYCSYWKLHWRKRERVSHGDRRGTKHDQSSAAGQYVACGFRACTEASISCTLAEKSENIDQILFLDKYLKTKFTSHCILGESVQSSLQKSTHCC